MTLATAMMTSEICILNDPKSYLRAARPARAFLLLTYTGSRKRPDDILDYSELLAQCPFATQTIKTQLSRQSAMGNTL